MKVLAADGVSGVGKTTLLKTLADRFSLLHLQASQLIKAEQRNSGSLPSTSEELRKGPVLDNQSLLVRGFHHATAGYDGVVLFDGHVLVDTDDGRVEIPSAVFESIGCVHIAVVIDDPQEIARRRAKDATRQRPHRSAPQIAEQQELVVGLANEIAAELGLPCSTHSIPEFASMETLIKELLAD